MYTIDIIITAENETEGRRIYTGNSHQYKTTCNKQEHIEESIKNILWESIEIDGLIGYIHVGACIDKNGKYIDTKSYEIYIETIVLTNEPSKYIQWGDKEPYIFTVDREKSIVKNFYTGLLL